MDLVVMGIAGLCFGILTAQTRTPRFQLLPFLSLLFLLLIAVIAVIQSGYGSPIGPFVFLAADIVAHAFYSAHIWRREGLDQMYTFWQLVWIDGWYPNQLRAALQGHLESTDRDAPPTA
ncbi:hypothetical protein LQ757_05965 [Agromyces sp. SYSU K20354]|uniref:hypothetical protein n=1 Tax=Agromyces cavernae TaxID=2898659 RepID=UPI001E2D7996|nr:hypothetical protein [Agromyces cavernae]MCD2441822.1 hypothetical protein [Agromyces cavernae]